MKIKQEESTERDRLAYLEQEIRKKEIEQKAKEYGITYLKYRADFKYRKNLFCSTLKTDFKGVF